MSDLVQLVQTNAVVAAVVVLTVVGALVSVVLASRTAKPAPVALDPREKRDFPLIARKNLSHDTVKFTFRLPTPQHKLGLPVGQHMFVGGDVKSTGKYASRPYTPVSSDADLGTFDLVVKVYRPCDRFPEGGLISQHLDALEIGECVSVRGPLGKITYSAAGMLTVKVGRELKPMPVRHIGMIAGGTGITPMLQIIRHIARRGYANDTTRTSLLFANQTEDDILVREELEEVAEQSDSFHLHYTLDRPPTEGWSHSTGFVDEAMIKANMPPPGPDTVILLCGPPPMITYACLPNLEALGYDKSRILTF